MKNTVYTLLAGVVLSACGAGDVSPESEIEMLILRRDSIKKVKDDLAQQLAIIELQIAEKDNSKPTQVITIHTVSQGTFKHSFEVYGEINSDLNAQINAEVAGSVTDIHVTEGQQVQKGQLLLSIDVQAMREQERELKTRLELAEITFQKQEKLWNEKIGSEMQYLQAKNNRDALKNSLDALRVQISKGSVTAPFAGVVDAVFPKRGEIAMPGLPVVRLVNLAELYITADVSENYVGKVSKGDKVKVSIPSTSHTRYAEIVRTGDYINPNNRTFKIKALLSNPDGLLKPNMVAQMEIFDYTADSVITIPESMLLDGAGNRKFVYVVSESNGEGVARKIDVSVDRIFRGTALITGGLNAGDIIVDKGARSIKDGEKVSIKNTEL